MEEFEGNGKWGALGEIRRAAVECQTGYVKDRGIKGRALAIAQGPDGTRGLAFNDGGTRYGDRQQLNVAHNLVVSSPMLPPLASICRLRCGAWRDWGSRVT